MWSILDCVGLDSVSKPIYFLKLDRPKRSLISRSITVLDHFTTGGRFTYDLGPTCPALFGAMGRQLASRLHRVPTSISP